MNYFELYKLCKEISTDLEMLGVVLKDEDQSIAERLKRNVNANLEKIKSGTLEGA